MREAAGPARERWEFRASPQNPKGRKLGGCLSKQWVGRINQHTNSWFVGHERCAVARYAAPPTSLGVLRRHFYMLLPSAHQHALNPKSYTLKPPNSGLLRRLLRRGGGRSSSCGSCRVGTSEVGFRVWVQDLGFGVKDLALRTYMGFRGLGLRTQGLGCRV